MIQPKEWYKWDKRSGIPYIKEPGIYYLAYSEENIDGTAFSYIPEIIYVGMSISNKGVLGRLDQFRQALENNVDRAHGGAERVRYKHKDTSKFFANAYVAVCSFPLSREKDSANDWRQKGECVKHEYVSFAEYLERFGVLPEFNDQKRSKKK